MQTMTMTIQDDSKAAALYTLLSAQPGVSINVTKSKQTEVKHDVGAAGLTPVSGWPEEKITIRRGVKWTV